MGVYLLLDGQTGEPVALIDGQRLTLWRTACASALAATYLARDDAEKLLVVGAGALAPFLARAHAAVRPIRAHQASGTARRPMREGRRRASRPTASPRHSPAISTRPSPGPTSSLCATISTEPLVHGRSLKPGTHVDLVGAFSPTMRESDDDAVQRARIFVDTREGAVKEAGDIVQPLQGGAIEHADIVADLFELARGEKSGRQGADEITLFKSVGAALEDLAAGIAVYRGLRGLISVSRRL